MSGPSDMKISISSRMDADDDGDDDDDDDYQKRHNVLKHSCIFIRKKLCIIRYTGGGGEGG